MQVPFVDLRAMHEEVRQEIQTKWSKLIDDSAFVGGPAVTEFEKAFATFCDARHCVGVGSGTDALRIALQAVGVMSGELVVTVPHTFIATVEAITQVGAVPAFVDIDPVSYTMDIAGLEQFLRQDCVRRDDMLVHRATGRRIACLLPVHLYGQPADMDPLMGLGREFGLPVVEDAAQAHGATYRGRPCGSLATVGAFSFYPGKNLGAMGEAGAITTDDPKIVDRCRVLREHGQRERYLHIRADGSNARLDAVQAVVLSAKLPRLHDWNEHRRQVAAWYRERLSDADLVLPTEMPYAAHVYHVYVVQVADRNGVRQRLGDVGVATGLHYPVPLHLQDAYADLGLAAGDFPVSETVASRGLSLPMFPHMTEAQVDRAASAVREAVTQAPALDRR